MYNPQPLDISHIELSEDIKNLVEKLAENVHDTWAKKRFSEGWTYGEERDDEKKHNPCLVPYHELPEIEKEYDRNVAMDTIKAIIALGFEVK